MSLQNEPSEFPGAISRARVPSQSAIFRSPTSTDLGESALARVDARKVENLTSPFEKPAPSIQERHVSNDEYAEMLKTQAVMAAKMVKGELSRAEILKLNLLRWEIGRIEGARFGEQLQRIEALVSLQEKLAREVDRLVAAVSK